MDRHAVKFTAVLSATELSVGSALHALRVPGRGQMLSLNQGFLLSRASFTGAQTRAEGARLSHLISLSAACLKSLAPAGKRLTPMLGISVQGVLFGLSQMLLGINYAGHIVGIWLVLGWAAMQPYLTGWLLNGNDFLKAIRWVLEKISPNHWPEIIAAIMLGWALVGVGLVVLSRRLSTAQWEKIEQRYQLLPSFHGAKRRKIPWGIFLSVGLTALFLAHAETSYSRWIWLALRPLGVAILFWIIIGLIPTDKVVIALKRRWPELGETIEGAIASRSAPPQC